MVFKLKPKNNRPALHLPTEADSFEIRNPVNFKDVPRRPCDRDVEDNVLTGPVRLRAVVCPSLRHPRTTPTQTSL